MPEITAATDTTVDRSCGNVVNNRSDHTKEKQMKHETQTLERADATVDVGANDVDYQKALGADDGGLVERAVEATTGVAGKVANKLDPLIEQYAGLFKTGLRTPVMRKPSDYGMRFEETSFPSKSAFRSSSASPSCGRCGCSRHRRMNGPPS
jgi:hypothetical protein